MGDRPAGGKRVRPQPLTEAQIEQRRAAGKARAEQRGVATEVRLADLRQHLAERREHQETGSQTPTEFEHVTFRGTVRGAKVDNAGQWNLLVEVPYADRTAATPLAFAAHIEVVFDVRRKSTASQAAALAGA